MLFEWDEDKRSSNIRKHGIDFVGVEKAFDGATLTVEDDRFDYGEPRFMTLALLGGRVVSMVHTEAQDVIRMISVRKANKNEEAKYFEEVAD